MEEKLEIFYIRHAEADDSLFVSRDKCDIDLTELGEQQIQLLAKRFAGQSFDAMLVSPLVRTVKTASAVCNQLGGKPTIELMPQLVENGTSYGYFGESVEYLSRYYDNLRINNDLPLIYGNVTDTDNDKRAKAVIEYIKQRFTYGQRVIVFSHGSFGGHFLSQAVGMDRSGCILSLNHTSISKVKLTSDGKRRISFLNDISHLRPIMPDYEFTI